MRIFFLLIATIVTACVNQNENIDHVPSNYQILDFSNFKYHQDTLLLKGKKYSGFVYQLNPESNDTLMVAEYLNGLQHGLSKLFFPNGKLMEKRIFKLGKKEGFQVSFWENGNKKFEFFAKDDRYEGTLKEWNKEGKLCHVGNYVKGQEEGSQKMWYSDGKIKCNYVIRNGKRYGLLGTKHCVNVSDNIFLPK